MLSNKNIKSNQSQNLADNVRSKISRRSVLAAGIAATLIGTYHYGWVCVGGVCTGYSTASVETAGFPLQPSGTGGLTPSTGATTANNLAAQGAVFARAINTNTQAGTLLVEVCGGI